MNMKIVQCFPRSLNSVLVIQYPSNYLRSNIRYAYIYFGHPILYTDVLDTLYCIWIFWPPCFIYGCFGHPVLYTDVLATLYYIRMFWTPCIIYGCFGHPVLYTDVLATLYFDQIIFTQEYFLGVLLSVTRH